jgi:hypothetical protein
MNKIKLQTAPKRESSIPRLPIKTPVEPLNNGFIKSLNNLLREGLNNK